MTSEELARLSNNLLYSAMAVYSLAMLGFTAGLAFFGRGRSATEDQAELAEPADVKWVDNQHRRWGSCTPADRTIRLSSRLRSMPEYVVDYVLVHELVHLLEPGHNDRFWALVARYPRAERARGFLEGVEQATAGPGADLVD